jgi:DNA-binding XRE family transcriptional regulator
LDIDLWTLDEDIPGHPCGSTVSKETIAAAEKMRAEMDRSLEAAIAYGKHFDGFLKQLMGQHGISHADAAAYIDDMEGQEKQERLEARQAEDEARRLSATEDTPQ